MMNSLCGTLAPLQKERSSSKPESSSPTTSVSESNNIAASKELEQTASTSLNLNFQGLKFEVDPDEVQSPNNNSLWESLFGDHTDTCTDYMISSPRRTPDFMIYSPKRNTEYLLPTPRKNPFGDVRSNVQGPSTLGNSPLSLSGAYGTEQKEKAQSPLQRVFHATNHFDNVGVPEHTPDYGRDSFGAYSTMKMTTGVSSSSENFIRTTTLGELFACSNLPSSTTFGSFAEARVQEDLHMTQERKMYQMSSMASGQLHHEQKQPPQQLQQNLHHSILANESQQDKDSGLELVHLLLACAEAVAKEDYMEARQYLHHLNCVVTPLGDSMQRVASCFTDALGARLAATLTTSPNTTFTSSPSNSLEVLNMYQILYQACPYIKFAHFTANQAIFEAIEAEERVHIIDLNILQGYQWPAFMQALASRPNGSPFLRITGVGYPLEAVRDTGRCLAELADSLRIPFEFHPVGEHLEDLKPHMFHRRVGEALAVNSMTCLHRVPGNHLGYILGMVRDQAPNIVTLVEQEANHNGPYFLGRFLEALHYYSAIFDSLDSTFPLDSAERAKVEQCVYALEIRNIVACEGPERVERHERLEKWRKVMEGKGFRNVPLSPNAVTQSEILLGLYTCEAYRLTEDRGCLLLGWQDRSLLASSAWRC